MILFKILIDILVQFIHDVTAVLLGMVFGFLKHHLAGMMHRKPVGNLGLGAGASKRGDGEDGSTSALLPVFQMAFTTIFLSRYPITVILFDIPSICTHVTPVK
jgi:hypothetical protein